MSNLWKITSFEDYQNNWPSIAGPFKNLTTYYKTWGYTSPEDFFNRNAFAAQELANDRVGSILERIFSTKDLPKNVQEQLRKFTYRAIDYLRVNDSQVIQQVRENSTSYNNGRSDNSQYLTSSLEALVGNQAWRSWTNANIEHLYSSYMRENNIEYILDPEQFYNKSQVDKLLSEVDDSIQMEHDFTEIEVKIVQDDLDSKYLEINNNLALKQNKSDQVLYTQKTDEFGEAIDDEIIELGTFDALAVLSKNAKSTVITTKENKRVAVLNINSDIGQVVDAVTQQTTSITDTINPIGRIWGEGVENNIKKNHEDLVKKYDELLTKTIELADLANSKWIEGEIKSMPIGSKMPEGWVKLSVTKGFALVAGTSVGTTSGEVKEHKHNINSAKRNYGGDYLTDVVGLSVDTIVDTKWIKNTGGPNNLAAGMYVEFWQYLPNGKSNINFSMPYHEKRLAEEKQEQERVARMASTPTFGDIQPVVEEIEKIKPVVEELKQKENHRLKKLGIDPNFKYWEDDDHE